MQKETATPQLRLRPALQTELPLIHLLTTAEPYFWHIAPESLSLQDFLDMEIKWFAVVDEADDYYGAACLSYIDWRNRSAGAGLVVLPDKRRSGVGLQCNDLLRDLAFSKMGLHKLWASVVEDNKVMWQALARHGWKHQGTMLDAQWLNGKWHNRRYYELLSTGG